MKPQTPLAADVPAPPVPNDEIAACLSALADGQADALAQGCQVWRDDAAARQTWHAYHLIGDVMRSDELAHQPGRDEAFLARLRGRLAEEPVVLAPAPLPALAPAPAAARASRWLMPAAVAAGFMVVAGVLVVTRLGGPAAEPTLAAASAARGGGITLAGTPGQAAPAAAVRGREAVIRDPRLDEYLRAHQSARAGVGMAAPGADLRQVEVEVVVPAGLPR